MAQQKRTGSHPAIRLFLGLVTLAALGQLYFYLFGPGSGLIRAQSATNGGNVHGYAWSSNYGWVSFNCNQTDGNTCATNNYGVSIDAVTGQFSGYAWSSNAGWIYFGPAEEMPEAIASSTAPAAPRQWPVYDFSNGRVSGWAKVVSMGTDEGWLSFTRDAANNQPGVRGTVDDATHQVRFDGFAWDGDTTNRVGVGWLEFDSARVGYVYATGLTGPLAENLVAPIRTNDAACATGDSKTIGVSFNYVNNFKYCYDAAGTSTNGRTCRDDDHCSSRFVAFPICKPGRMEKYDLVLKSDAAGDQPVWPAASADEVGTTSYRFADNDAGISFYSNNDANFNDQVQWGAAYHVWVRTWDEHNQTAGWVSLNRTDDGGWIVEDGNPATFTMPEHNVPKVDFIWTPANPSKEEIVTFEPTDSTSTTAVCRSTDGEETVGIKPDTGQGDSWSWIFNNGNPAASTEEKPKVQMVNNGLTSIILTLRDSDGYQCTTTPRTFNANLKLPNWKEQNPK
jgi:hypothetical protein